MRAKVERLGQYGLVSDTDSYETPPNAWSSIDNMRCNGYSIGTFLGYQKLDDLSARPDCIEYIRAGTQPIFAYANGQDIYSWFSGTETEISSRTYITGEWQSCVLGGVAIFNNGSENPQYWGGSGTCTDLPFDDTCTWTEAELQANVIRSFKNFAFALGVTVCGSYNPRRLIWSHPAETGTVPSSWDIADSSTLAGDNFLSDTSGDILDGLGMRDSFVIYKEDAIHSATYTGDSRGAGFIWNFRLVSTNHGIYARNCVCDIGGRHVFIGDGDIYLFDGTYPRSIANDRVRDLFFDNVNREFYDNTFVTFHERKSEVWICYPTGSNEYCDSALIWNVEKDVWYARDLPNVSCATYGVLADSSGYTWNTLPYATWDDWGITPSTPTWTTWNAAVSVTSIEESLIMGGASKLIRMDKTQQEEGVDFTCTAQKTHLDIGDAGDWHTVVGIYPRATGDAFRVRLGYHDTINDSVTWSDYQTFTPGTDYKLDFRVTGRQHAIEFSSITDVSWEIHSYEVAYEYAGAR